jgi:hypothetical protein
MKFENNSQNWWDSRGSCGTRSLWFLGLFLVNDLLLYHDWPHRFSTRLTQNLNYNKLADSRTICYGFSMGHDLEDYMELIQFDS